MSEQSDTPSWWRCDTHGPGTRTAWGCPECVRELRTSLATATRERDEARAEVERLRKVLHRLACLGNGDQYGNSFGNDIARAALAATEAKP